MKIGFCTTFQFKTTSFDKWDTIKPGLASLAWPGFKADLTSIFGLKVGPPKVLAWFQSWPGLKFGLERMPGLKFLNN